MEETHQLAIIGANRAGLGVAADAYRSGIERIIFFSTEDADLSELTTQPDVHSGPPVTRLTSDESGVTIECEDVTVRAEVVVAAGRVDKVSVRPDYSLPDSLSDRIHFSMPDSIPETDDILIIGTGETAAEYCESLVESGHNSVVLSLPSVAFDQLAVATRDKLQQIESALDATIMWHAHPEAIHDAGGFPLVMFSDRRTPDLVFDRILYCLGSGDRSLHLDRLGIEVAQVDIEQPRIIVLTEEDHPEGEESADEPMAYFSPGHAWDEIREAFYPELPGYQDLPSRPPLLRYQLAVGLRDKHYNATITSFNRKHGDLWIIRVKPDRGDLHHSPGQYATLALGYWEPRLDGRDEHLDEPKFEKLVRRSYSISHPVLDENDDLVAPEDIDGLEFYIVLVRPEGLKHLPELTPRLALKSEGDRIFLGTKISGRYTLDPVTDPTSDVILLSTGTGEAPHNNMITQLLSSGHTGMIVSACTVRYEQDLAYLETHRRLESLYSNYRYLPLTTREADTINNKVYIQDTLTNGMLADALGHEPSPETSHVFLCGNPSMIGIAEWDGENPTWPETTGVCEILYERGFTIDHRGVAGNVHYEEYW